MEKREYWQGVSSKSLVHRFGKHASQRLHRGTESRREEEDRRVRTGSWSRSNLAR